MGFLRRALARVLPLSDNPKQQPTITAYSSGYINQCIRCKENRCRPNQSICDDCMHEMSYNSHLDVHGSV